MVQATTSLDTRAIAAASVADPVHVDSVSAVLNLYATLHRSRLLTGQGSSGVGLLLMLDRCGPTRQSELAGALQLDQSTVSRHLASLIETGLVERSADPGDRRAVLVQVTPAGRDRAALAVRERVATIEALLRAWPDDDRRAFARLLGRFTDELDGIVDARADQGRTAPTHHSTNDEASR